MVAVVAAGLVSTAAAAAEAVTAVLVVDAERAFAIVGRSLAFGKHRSTKFSRSLPRGATHANLRTESPLFLPAQRSNQPAQVDPFSAS